jgi:hypothetical protein
MSFWRDYTSFTSEVLEVPRFQANVVGVASVLMLLAMIAQTWFIWVEIIATALTILALLLVAEHSLRTWYWLCDHADPTAPVLFCPPPDRAVPDQLPTRCADAQGCIESENLRGQDVSKIAEKIFRHAVVRKTCDRRPCWLRFPAICRALPRLAQAGRVFWAVCTR